MNINTKSVSFHEKIVIIEYNSNEKITPKKSVSFHEKIVIIEYNSNEKVTPKKSSFMNKILKTMKNIIKKYNEKYN